MKRAFILLALGSVTALSANYNQQNPSNGQPINQGQGNYQNPNGPRISVQMTEQPAQGYSQGTIQANNPDRTIEKSISDTVTGGWFSKGYTKISYQVNNGRVTLMGSVDTEEDKTKVVDSIRKVPGVVSVDDQLKVTGKASNSSSGWGFTGATGASGSTGATGVTNNKSSGQPNVYAFGSTGSTTQNSDLNAKELNESEKKYSNDTAGTDTDRQINAKARKALSNWLGNGYNDTIILRTTNGLVIITGTVKNQDDIKKIVDQVRKVDGVKQVNPQITAKK